MEELFLMPLIAVLCLLPFLLVAMDFVFFVKKQEYPLFELISFFLGSCYMGIAYSVWDLPDYRKSLNIYGTASIHEPFAREYMLGVVVVAAWGFFSYFWLKFRRRTLPPLVEVFLLAGVYAGCILCVVWCFQLVCGGHPESMAAGVLGENAPEYHLHMTSLDYFMVLCLCSVPGLYLLHVGQLLYCLVKEKAKRQETIVYKNKIMQALNVWFLRGANLFWTAGVVLLPVLGILMLLLVIFGQQPDSMILAFTQTSDWILSKETAPPPVAYDTHYLCTVSLRGHKRLVKPLRYGIRRGEKIVVNRQLCVANAFEQFLMEKTPHFHKKVRHFYDTYGYPVSKHINNAWSADFTYLLMKPLEWIFLFVLYLFDRQPENRIATQYLPSGCKSDDSGQ